MKCFIPKLLLLFPLFIPQVILAQSPNWEWVRNFENADYSYTVADTYGNVYITGRFSSSSLVIGSFTLSNSSSGSDDIYLAKFDATGSVIWVRSAGGASTDYPMAITVDLSGNIYITGLFQSPTISFSGSTMANSGVVDPFLAKYDGSGNVLWVRQGVGNNNDASRAVTTDALGNVYMAGQFFSSTITFGAIILNHSQSADAFVVKYDQSGNAIWAKSSSGDWEESPFNIAVDNNGNVFITGYFNSTSATFESITLNKSGSYSDMFIVKYDASGTLEWAKNSMGSYHGVEAYGLVTDAAGNVFVSGHFEGTIMFGSFSLTSVGARDIYIIKFDPAGNALLATQIGGNGDEGHEIGNALSIDPYQNIYVTGKFGSTVTSGSTAITSSGLHDCFIAKIDVLGNIVWAKRAGGSQEDEAYSVSYKDGAIYLSGYVNSDPADFDDIAIPKSSFLAKLPTCPAISAGNDALVFFGNSAITSGLSCTTLTADLSFFEAGGSFDWTSFPLSAIQNNSSNQVTVCPEANTLYTVTYTTSSGCIGTDNVLVKAIDVSCGSNNNKVKICITTSSGQQNTICVASTSVQAVLANNPNAVLGDCSAYNSRTANTVVAESATNGLKIYPNPSNDHFILKFDNNLIDQKISLRIFDLQGKLIESRNDIRSDRIVQLGKNYKPGVYIAEIMQGNRRTVIKLVKL